LGICRVEEITNEEFVAKVVQVEMQHCHFYTAHHVTMAINVAVAYLAKHKIIDIDMV
jgi:hypothetical protein